MNEIKVMEKSSLVKYDEKGNIVDCDFSRIDFSNPTTILDYGNDVKEAISNILDKTAEMSISSQEIQIDDEKIKRITSFDDTLTKVSEAKEKEDKTPAIFKGAKSILQKVGITKKKDNEFTYKSRYEDYCEEINSVCEAVASQMQGSLNDINLRKAIIDELIPYIEKLKAMVEVGRIDKETFDSEIEKLRSETETPELQYEIQYKTQLSQIFNSKLAELEKAVALYGEQIQSYRLQQGTDMELVMNSKAYLTDSAPILKAQGSVMVFNRQQEQRIDTMTRLNKATNEAIVENARDLEKNVKDVTDLTINGSVSIATLESLNNALKKGVEIFRDGREKKQAQIANDRRSLEKINASMMEYQQALQELIDEKEDISSSLAVPKQYVKRHGKK